MNETRSIDTLAAVAGGYKAIFCDVWGVVHNGVAKHLAAEGALRQARGMGVTVVLLTNSPRPSEGVRAQLDTLGFSPDAYDAIVTSGDVTRGLIERAGGNLFHIGPERDLDLFAGIDAHFVGEEDAATVVATGLFRDEEETPADYAELLGRLRARDLPMICANPDIVVHRGEKLIFCAGSVAKEYEAMGGRVSMAGKPFSPIYAHAAGIAALADPSEVLAIGDGLNTDIRGANAYGADALLVMEGIHRDELGGSEVEGEVLTANLSERGLSARYFMPRLA